MAAVLEGIRVLDLTTIVAGLAASMILADLGADVIKIERPGEAKMEGAWDRTADRGERTSRR